MDFYTKPKKVKKIPKTNEVEVRFLNGRIKSVLKSVYDIYAAFCKETTLHGLKHTVAEDLHWVERLLWLVLIIAAFFGAVYCALSQLSRYNSEPVVVSLQRNYRGWWTTFPAITACFIERVDGEKAKAAIERIWNVTEEDPEKYGYYAGFITLIAEVSLRTNLQNFWKYQDDDTVKGIDLQQLAQEVHPTQEVVVYVSQSTKEVQWTPVMTEEGMCMTFNSLYAKHQFILADADWTSSGLQHCHFHSGQCFVRVDSIQNALRYFVHSPFEISTAISNPTGEVMPGEELIIDFKAVEIQASPGVKKLRPDQRRCQYPDEWISNSIQAYSFGLCQMNCRNRMALMFCGCRPYFHVKGDGDVCDAHGMACIGRNMEILVNLPKNLAKCPCQPQCAELNYYSHTKKIVFRQQIIKHPFHSTFHQVPLPYFYYMNETQSDGDVVAAVRFNLMPPKLRFNRDVIFTLEDLFASLGGTTALFVGASVLTVVETMLFIIRQLVRMIFDKNELVGRKILDWKGYY